MVKTKSKLSASNIKGKVSKPKRQHGNACSDLPFPECRHLFSSSIPKVIWVGEKDELGESKCVSSKEGKARAVEALTSYVLRMQHRTPFCWFQEDDGVLKWQHPIASPIEVILDTSALCNLGEEKTYQRLITQESVLVMIEHALSKYFGGSDTCASINKDRVLLNARKSLFENLPQQSNSGWPALEKLFMELQDSAYDLLSHMRDANGKVYTSTQRRGIMDRRLYNFLLDRHNYYSPPAQWAPGDTFTAEQSNVFALVLDHLRLRGWSVLSGPGGAGKTHMMRHLSTLCVKTQVHTDADGHDCPSCGQERLINTCATCGYKRQPGGTRFARVCFLGPTNRAVAMLQTAIGSDKVSVNITVGTIHSVTRRRDLEQQDLVVIDEGSMLATEHYDLLLKTEIFRTSAWLLVGDHLQLLPVGNGELFRPLKILSQLPSLTKNMRVKTSALAHAVEKIRTGSVDCALAFENHCQNRADLQKRIYEAGCDLVICIRNEERVRYNAFCIQLHRCEYSELKGLDDYRKFAIDGDLGKFVPRSFVPFTDMPVRFQTNYFKPQACRGDIGIIKSVIRAASIWQIQVDVNNETIRIDSSFFTIPEFIRPAFAITLHDAQGAQYPSVAVVLPPSPLCPLLSLEALYTAVSRAQDRMLIYTCGCRLHDMLGCFSSISGFRTTPLGLLLNGRDAIASPSHSPAADSESLAHCP